MPRPRKTGMEMLPPGVYMVDGDYVRRVKQPNGGYRKVVVASGELTPDQASTEIDGQVLDENRTVGWLMRAYIRHLPERVRIIHVEMMRGAFNIKTPKGPLGSVPLKTMNIKLLRETMEAFRPYIKRRHLVVLMTWLGEVYDYGAAIGAVKINHPRRAIEQTDWATRV